MEPLRGVVQNYEWGMRTPDCQARPQIIVHEAQPRHMAWLPPLRRVFLRGVCSGMQRTQLRGADAAACALRCAMRFASQVASLGAANTGAAAEAGRPYAELWLGTHPSGPAVLPGAWRRRAPRAKPRR